MSLTKQEWKKVDEILEFIHINTDRCCQDLCEGQMCKYNTEDLMELLSKIRPDDTI